MVAVLLGGALALPVLFSGEGRATLSKEVGARTMPAVVFVLAADLKDGQLVPVMSGSGTILTPDGAVLTNHHVVFDKDQNRLHDVVAIGLLKKYDQAPELTCLAVPKNGVIDADLDLAVVRCEMDLSGKPYHAAGWPTVPIGSSNDLIPGASEVYIMGYPGVGGSTIHVTRGTVSGFLGKEGGSGRFWIKTDAAIAHGNSGGTAIDDAGTLVAIPTAVFPGTADDGERVGLMRPVELAKPLIQRALAGGDATGFGDNVGKEDTPPPGAGTCPVRSGVTLTGRVRASDNNAAIEGAYVIVLKPGAKRRDVEDDYSNIESVALTYGVTNHTGEFVTVCPIPRDTVYTVIVLAKGFRELAGNDVLDTTRAPDRFAPWNGVIRLQRIQQ